MGASSLPSNPLFSSIVTLYILILLYFPPFFFNLAISPTLISTIILLLSLLRLGTSQRLSSSPQQNPPCVILVEGQVEPGTDRLKAQPLIKFEKYFESESVIVIANETSHINTSHEAKQEFDSGSRSESGCFTFIAKESSQLDTTQEEADGEAKLSQLDTQQPSTSFAKEFEFVSFAFVYKEISQINTNQEEPNGDVNTCKLDIQPLPRLETGFEFESESESFTFPNVGSHILTGQEEVKAEPHCAPSGTQTNADPNTRPDPSICDINARQEEKKDLGLSRADNATDPNPFCSKTFVEWDVWAPLEIIYEDYEGEEDEEENQNDALNQDDRYAKATERYFPDTDTNTDTDTDTYSSEEGEREGLIEIALDYYGFYDNNADNNNYNKGMKMKLSKEVEVDDEDNLIEIDISPTRSNEFYW